LIHQLPSPDLIRPPHDPQPIDAPPRGPHDKTSPAPSADLSLYPATYGAGYPLVDHGGPQIGGAGFMAIYWNSSVSGAKQTSLGYTSLADELHSFISNFSGVYNWSNSVTADYTIIQQYGSHVSISPSLFNAGVFVDSQKAASSISDTQLRSYLASLFNARKVPFSPNYVYGLFLPSGMKVTLSSTSASCTSFCGYHGHFSYSGYDIKYISFPYPNCSACSLSGKTIADMLTIITSHELREAVTDPDFNAWYDGLGYEADDKCAWHNLYQMSKGGFWVQPEYSNGGTVSRSGFTATYPGPGCIVPR